METVCPRARLSARRLLTCVCACLLLLQTFASVDSRSGRPAFSNDGLGAALSWGGAPCAAIPHDGGKGLPHHPGHCAFCVAGRRDLALQHAVALVATILVLAQPPSEAAPAWARSEDLKPPLAGWASSWSSRAPPFFS